jgi:hypothetical protein
MMRKMTAGRRSSDEREEVSAFEVEKAPMHLWMQLEYI